MNECGLNARCLKKYRSYKGRGSVVPDLLKRNFMAERPNQSGLQTLLNFLFGKKLYLSPNMDLTITGK